MAIADNQELFLKAKYLMNFLLSVCNSLKNKRS